MTLEFHRNSFKLKMDECAAHHCYRLFHRHGWNLSFPGLIHQYGRCFLKDGSHSLSNRFTNYLNCCLFCLFPPHLPLFPPLSLCSWSCIKHLKMVFKNKKTPHVAATDLALRHTGKVVLFPGFHPSTFDLRTPAYGPKCVRRARANWVMRPVHDKYGVFPCPRWVLGADGISSTPKCFPFLSHFIFFPFLIGLWLSGPSHMLCVTSCSEQQPYLPWKARGSMPWISPLSEHWIYLKLVGIFIMSMF